MYNIDIEHLYTVNGYITYTILVTSGSFSGESSFCISRVELESAINELETISSLLVGSFTLGDFDSDDYIQFEMHELGHMTINGQIGGSNSQQYLVYSIQTDQTELDRIIRVFRESLYL